MWVPSQRVPPGTPSRPKSQATIPRRIPSSLLLWPPGFPGRLSMQNFRSSDLWTVNHSGWSGSDPSEGDSDLENSDAWALQCFLLGV